MSQNKSKIKYVLVVLGTVIFLSVTQRVYNQFTLQERAPKVSQDTINNLEQSEENETVALGQFIKIDLIHYASGEASIIESNDSTYLKFDNNFKVAEGPDLFVYLSPNVPKKIGDDLGEFVNLGELKSKSGEQVYNIPENYKDYKSVVIWCRAFGILFSSAELSYEN